MGKHSKPEPQPETDHPTVADELREVLNTPDSPWVVGEPMTRDEFLKKLLGHDND